MLTDERLAELRQALDSGAPCDDPDVRRELLDEIERLKEADDPIYPDGYCQVCGQPPDNGAGWPGGKCPGCGTVAARRADFGEPWVVAAKTDGELFYEIHNTVGGVVAAYRHEGVAKRIVACVNACAGMADPEDEIALMRKVNDRLCDQTMEISNLQEDCEAKDAEIERLKGAGTDERVERAMRQVARLRTALDAISESYWRSACKVAEKRLTAAAAECVMARNALKRGYTVDRYDWKQARALTDKFGGPEAWCKRGSPEAPQDETEDE